MMTSLHTDTRRQASNAGVRGHPQGRVMYTQVGLAVTRHTRSSRRKRPDWVFEGKRVCVPTHPPHQVSVSSTPQSCCIVLHLKIKEHFEPWHLVSQRWGRLHEHLQRIFFFFFLYQSPRCLCQHCKELKGIYLNPNIYGWKKKSLGLCNNHKWGCKLSPTAGKKEYETVESISCIFLKSLINEKCCSAYCAPMKRF